MSSSEKIEGVPRDNLPAQRKNLVSKGNVLWEEELQCLERTLREK